MHWVLGSSLYQIDNLAIQGFRKALIKSSMVLSPFLRTSMVAPAKTAMTHTITCCPWNQWKLSSVYQHLASSSAFIFCQQVSSIAVWLVNVNITLCWIHFITGWTYEHILLGVTFSSPRSFAEFCIWGPTLFRSWGRQLIRTMFACKYQNNTIILKNHNRFQN